MREVVGKNPIESILTVNRDAIQDEVRALMQSSLDAYGAGVAVTRIQMQKADPPPQVLDAYRDVQAARTDQTACATRRRPMPTRSCRRRREAQPASSKKAKPTSRR